MATPQKITPFLWFNDQAEEAAKFYVTLFDDSKILSVMPGPQGKAMGVQFQLAGIVFQALNGGPAHQLNEAFSLFVTCEDQQEVDSLWARLTANGGQESRCGWLKDRFGLSWQIVPRRFMELVGDPDRTKAGRVMEAMLKMTKFDIAALERAYAGT
ncbi:MAG: VOC family protein [Myxococcaceae bacterium]|nr:VOC family protein [Myxococcaceae bacterium]